MGGAIPRKRKHMNRDQIMTYFRLENAEQDLSPDDRIEIFLTVLLGSSDITKDLIEDLFNNYGMEYLQYERTYD